MKVYIPSAGRANRQITLRNLAGVVEPVLVVPVAEVDAYKASNPAAKVLGCDAEGIAATRQAILYDIHRPRDGNMLMLDDDLTWSVRRKDDPSKFMPATPASLRRMFAEVEKMLGKHVHGAIAAREQGHSCPDKHRFNTRPLRALAYDVAAMRKLGITFNRLPFMEDFDVTLQLLRAGYSNFIVNGWVHNQSGSGATGGCSASRTPEKQAACANKLAKLHPGFVKVVQKSTKTAWADSGMTTRTDVVIQWKQAFKSSQQTSLPF